jgi:hypothetical protein
MVAEHLQQLVRTRQGLRTRGMPGDEEWVAKDNQADRENQRVLSR